MSTTTVRPLICIFSARDVPDFHKAAARIDEDKLWIKYYKTPDAYPIALEQFLKRPEYTHLVILPDDLIVTQDTINILKDDITKNDEETYPVISGWCNAYITEPRCQDTDFSQSLPPVPSSEMKYDDYKFVKIAWVEDYLTYNAGRVPIIQVMHQGNALTFLSRKLIVRKQIKLGVVPPPLNCCADSSLSLQLHEKGIKQYVDLRARSLHLKENDSGVIQGHEIQHQFKASAFYLERWEETRKTNPYL